MAETTPRVLVVDDERFFREAIREALAEPGSSARRGDGAAAPGRRATRRSASWCSTSSSRT